VSEITMFLMYLGMCLLYRSRQANQVFILKILQSLKSNKHRNKINQKIKNHEKRHRWFFAWPIIDLYERYEDWKEDRNRNVKS
jgi:hypothetical protein